MLIKKSTKEEKRGKLIMTDASKTVLNYLKKNCYGHEMTKQAIADALGVSMATITGSVKGLKDKGFIIDRAEEVQVAPATETHAAKMKTIHYIQINDAGLAFDPVEYEKRMAEKALEKREAAKAARRANKVAGMEA